MSDMSEIISQFESLEDFGKACGFVRNPEARASDVKRRGKLSVDRWPALLAEAKKRKLPISEKTLLALRANSEGALDAAQ